MSQVVSVSGKVQKTSLSSGENKNTRQENVINNWGREHKCDTYVTNMIQAYSAAEWVEDDTDPYYTKRININENVEICFVDFDGFVDTNDMNGGELRSQDRNEHVDKLNSYVKDKDKKGLKAYVVKAREEQRRLDEPFLSKSTGKSRSRRYSSFTTRYSVGGLPVSKYLYWDELDWAKSNFTELEKKEIKSKMSQYKKKGLSITLNIQGCLLDKSHSASDSLLVKLLSYLKYNELYISNEKELCSINVTALKTYEETMLYKINSYFYSRDED